MRIAMLSYHTCPLATLGGKDTGGMNVYVRDLTTSLGRLGIKVDVFTRSQDEHVPHVLHDLGYGNRVVHVPAGPETPLPKPELTAYLPQFVQDIRNFAQYKDLHLQALREHYSVTDLVNFLGKRGQDTLPYYYSAAEAVVMPSQYESFGMVALEAMACGAPVVASQVGGLAFLVQDGKTGYTVPAGDPEALCQRLQILLHDKDLRRQMGENAYTFAQEYAWEKITARIIGLYEDLLSKRKTERILGGNSPGAVILQNNSC